MLGGCGRQAQPAVDLLLDRGVFDAIILGYIDLELTQRLVTAQTLREALGLEELPPVVPEKEADEKDAAWRATLRSGVSENHST